jgi:heptaprenylglyceryl phosphate synthase
LSIDINQSNEREALSNKISELESSLKQPITLIKNIDFPFFDTSISKKVDFVNSVSLLNTQSINDFENKVNKKIETSIFRGNICIDGIEPLEREGVGLEKLLK